MARQKKLVPFLIWVAPEQKEECRRISKRDREPMAVIVRRMIRRGLDLDRRREQARA